MKKLLSFIVIFIIIALALSACEGPDYWNIASQGDTCTPATVIDRQWSNNNHNNFYLLLKAEDGEIGIAIVNEYQYDALQMDATTCVIK